MIAKASVQNNEEYLRHIWSNSTVRDVIANNCVNAKQFTSKLTRNPGKELENVANILKETVERSSVVAESVRQYAVSRAGPIAAATQPSPGSSKDTETVEDKVGGLDISSITLKELEQYLSQKSDPQTIKFKGTTTSAAKSSETPKEQLADPKLFLKDEQYVQDWMKFISQHDPKAEGATASAIKKTTHPPAAQAADTKLSEPALNIQLPELSSVSKQRKVPSSRIARMASFGGLFAGLGIGTVNSLAKGALGLGGATDMKSALFSPANAERIVDTLCRVRGAALKLGQILSIQDSSIVSPQLVKAFDRVRQAADYMPDWQVEKTLKQELGDGWEGKLQSFDRKPFAAASIGQVHRAILPNGMEVAIKIQYPGVAQSIGSDIDNLVGMLKVWDVFPAGIFIDNVVKVSF